MQDVSGIGTNNDNSRDFKSTNRSETFLSRFTGVNDVEFRDKDEISPFFETYKSREPRPLAIGSTGRGAAQTPFNDEDRDRYARSLNIRDDCFEAENVGPGIGLDPKSPAGGGFHQFYRWVDEDVKRRYTYGTNMMNGPIQMPSQTIPNTPYPEPNMEPMQDTVLTRPRIFDGSKNTLERNDFNVPEKVGEINLFDRTSLLADDAAVTRSTGASYPVPPPVPPKYDANAIRPMTETFASVDQPKPMYSIDRTDKNTVVKRSQIIPEHNAIPSTRNKTNAETTFPHANSLSGRKNPAASKQDALRDDIQYTHISDVKQRSKSFPTFLVERKPDDPKRRIIAGVSTEVVNHVSKNNQSDSIYDLVCNKETVTVRKNEAMDPKETVSFSPRKQALTFEKTVGAAQRGVKRAGVVYDQYTGNDVKKKELSTATTSVFQGTTKHRSDKIYSMDSVMTRFPDRQISSEGREITQRRSLIPKGMSLSSPSSPRRNTISKTVPIIPGSAGIQSIAPRTESIHEAISLKKETKLLREGIASDVTNAPITYGTVTGDRTTHGLTSKPMTNNWIPSGVITSSFPGMERQVVPIDEDRKSVDKSYSQRNPNGQWLFGEVRRAPTPKWTNERREQEPIASKPLPHYPPQTAGPNMIGQLTERT